MEKIEVLLEEYKLINEKIEQFIRNQHQYLNTSLIVIGGFLIFAFTGGKEYVKFLPIITGLILGFIGYHYQRTIGLQGYKIYLERSINEILKTNVICYAQIGMVEMVKKNRFGGFNLLIYITFYMLISVIAYELNPNTDGRDLWVWIYIGLFAVLLIAGFPIIGYSKRVTEKAFEINNTKITKE